MKTAKIAASRSLLRCLSAYALRRYREMALSKICAGHWSASCAKAATIALFKLRGTADTNTGNLCANIVKLQALDDDALITTAIILTASLAARVGCVICCISVASAISLTRKCVLTRLDQCTDLQLWSPPAPRRNSLQKALPLEPTPAHNDSFSVWAPPGWGLEM